MVTGTAAGGDDRVSYYFSSPTTKNPAAMPGFVVSRCAPCSDTPWKAAGPRTQT
jgi:hypothetical protein